MPKVSQDHLEKRKFEILEAAERVFKRKGFEPTTMQDVVEESGMSRGGVYRYFSSTEEMLEAIHERKIQELSKELKSLLDQYPTVWEVLEHLLGEYEKTEEDEANVGFGIIMYEYSVTSWRNERHRQFIIRNAVEARKSFISLLQAGVDRGEFHPILPLHQIVEFMFNVTDGLVLYGAIDAQGFTSIEQQIESLKIYLRTVLKVEQV